MLIFEDAVEEFVGLFLQFIVVKYISKWHDVIVPVGSRFAQRTVFDVTTEPAGVFHVTMEVVEIAAQSSCAEFQLIADPPPRLYGAEREELECEGSEGS
jgi:hypothetical protein